LTEQAPYGLDTTTPNVARIYDYLLGGKDNFAADRAAAEHLLAAIPDVAAVAADNRAFLARAVRFLAVEKGIRQFLDLGSGLPTRSNVHEVAQRAAPGAHVVYVDYDPMVVRHGQALLARGDEVGMLHADLAEPAAVLEDPEVRRVLDLRQPLALLFASSLHFIPDEADPYGIVAQYRDRIAPGSFLAISHAPSAADQDDPAGDADTATSVFRQSSAHLHARTRAEVQLFFDGFDLVEPGVAWISQWRPEPDARPAGRLRSLHAGVGRKP
jgi:S-adenosyl methyltransferase